MNSDSAEDLILQNIEYLKQECPKIDSALKNLVSVLLAYSDSSSTLDLSGASSQKDICGSPVTLTPKEALLCAKIFASTLSRGVLPVENSWINEHPQGPNESAIDRLDSIVHYRSLLFIYSKIIESKQSVIKFFGRSFFKWSNSFKLIRDEILNSSSSSSSSSDQIEKSKIEYFLDQFEASLLDSSESLIWSRDMKASLADRAAQRVIQASERSFELSSSE